MNRYLAVLLLAVAPAAAQPSALADTLLRLERTYVQAEIDQDVPTLDRLFADDLRYTGINGAVISKEQALGWVRHPSLTIAAIELSDLHVRPLGEDAAVVTGHADLEMHFAGDDYSGPYRFTRVYHRREAGWQIVAGQTARIPE